eukprot:131574_1
MRYITYQQQLDDLTQRIKGLEQQNKAKDQLLNGNSKVIMEKTTEIIKLKDEIDELKDTLSNKEGQTNHSHPLPSVCRDFNYHHMQRTACHAKSQSDSSTIYKFKKKQPTKPLPSDPKVNEMPFIHRKTSTQTSTLSEAAVNLSFPTSPIQIPGAGAIPIASVKPLQLSPICEMKSRDDETKKKRINLIQISDDNSNIVKEWGQSIAGSEDQAAIDQKITNAAIVRVSGIPNEFTFIEPHDTVHDDNEEMEHGHAWDNSSEVSFCEYLNVRKQSDNISYCSDNTIMLNDINMEIQQHTNVNSVDHMEILSNTKHFSKKSNGNLNVNECDIIESPVKVFLNHSFQIVVNND